MMTLDDAIKHAEEVAEKEEERINKTFATFGEDRPLFKVEENECKKCAEEHRQLAEWLKDYKRLLEQQHTDDCVSMKKVLKEIYRLWNCSGDKDYCMETLRDFVSELPPVTPKHKKGKWIMPDKYYDKNIWRKCSVCNTHFEKYNKYISFSGAVTYTEQIANYCKVCGAEMECEDDSN